LVDIEKSKNSNNISNELTIFISFQFPATVISAWVFVWNLFAYYIITIKILFTEHSVKVCIPVFSHSVLVRNLWYMYYHIRFVDIKIEAWHGNFPGCKFSQFSPLPLHSFSALSLLIFTLQSAPRYCSHCLYCCVVFTTVISNDFIMPIKRSVHQNEIILELKILAALKNSADVLIKIFGHVVFFIF
jgi:hypothetical protein